MLKPPSLSNAKMSGSGNLWCWVAYHEEATSAGSAWEVSEIVGVAYSAWQTAFLHDRKAGLLGNVHDRFKSHARQAWQTCILPGPDIFTFDSPVLRQSSRACCSQTVPRQFSGRETTPHFACRRSWPPPSWNRGARGSSRNSGREFRIKGGNCCRSHAPGCWQVARHYSFPHYLVHHRCCLSKKKTVLV